MSDQYAHHCEHCVTHLKLGPRAKRILLMLTRHPEWNTDQFAGINFRFPSGNDDSRVTYQEIGREQCEEAA